MPTNPKTQKPVITAKNYLTVTDPGDYRCGNNLVLEHIPLTFSRTPHAQRNLHIPGD